MHNPGPKHWDIALRVLDYVEATKHYGLLYKHTPDFSMQCYVDAGFADEADDRRSTTGVIITLGGVPWLWQCKRQKHALSGEVATSTFESEIRAAFTASQLVVYARQFLDELGYPVEGATNIWEDNDACRIFSIEEMHQSRAKHLEIKMTYLRELILRRVVNVNRIDTDEQRADILTKNAIPKTFMRHVVQLMNCGDDGPIEAPVKFVVQVVRSK